MSVGPWARSACADGLGGEARRVGGALSVHRVGRDVGVRGALEGAADVPCDRCGETVFLAVAMDLSCLYLAPRADDEGEPATDYEDLGDYDGVALDLAEAIRECFVLERPARVLCSEHVPEAERAGVDAACFARFQSAVGEPAVDPRLSALARFKN